MEAKQFLEAGKRLASPAPGDEVVVSGMAGRFPESDNIYELWDNLITHRDMVTLDDRRWDITKPGIPHRGGKVGHLEKFDAGFFGIGYREATAMDPQCKLLLERSVEAIFDAGWNLQQIKGTRTGVIVGNSTTEIERTWYHDKLESGNNAITGCTRSMQAQRISRVLRLKGPTLTIDTGSSSSIYALEHGYRAIRTGKCDNVLVCASNVCLQPKITSQYFKLGALSPDGKCKCFDESADGIVRSEAIVVVFLQKAKDAKRIYGQIVHIKTNVDGYKEKGQTYPAGDMQKKLMDEIYEECCVDPSTIHYLESHATGTKIGDPEEIVAAGQVFCKNRTKPLPIGSLKSNLGHTEPTSGLCSFIKILMCMENDMIPANLNFSKVKKGLEAIETGQMVVVTENIPWPEKGAKLAALNNYGLGGANSHVVIRQFSKKKLNQGLLKEDLPRLVCVSGRTQEAINCILDDVSKRTLDVEFIRLIQEVFEYNMDGHPYRGYGIISKNGTISKSVEKFVGSKQPLCLFLGNFDPTGLKNTKPLFELFQFQTIFQKINRILSPINLNLMDAMNKDLNGNFTNIMMASVAVQIAVIEILKNLHLEFGYFIGHSFGIIAAAYGDGALTLEQAILTAYHIAQNWPVDKGSENLQIREKAQVIKLLENYMHVLESPLPQFDSNKDDYQDRKFFPTGQFTGSTLVKQLDQIIKTPKKLSSKWLTDLKEEHVYASPNYFVSQLLNNESKVIDNVPANVLLLKMGSESFGKKDDGAISLSDVTIDSILDALGRIYNFGFNPKVANLYPEVQWPVSSKTPMISPLIKWNYDIDWFIPRFTLTQTKKPGVHKFQLDFKSTTWTFLSGHVLDGRNLVPGTAYIYIAWEAFALERGKPMLELNVIFEDVRFLRATRISKNSDIELTVSVQMTSGKFEVLEQNQLVASGYIGILDTKFDHIEESSQSGESVWMTSKDIYKELSLRGYNYTGEFQNVQQCNLNVTKGWIKWNGNWIAFIDNMLQLKLIQSDSRNLKVGTLVEELTINAKDHLEYCKKFQKNSSLPVYLNNQADSLRCGGIELKAGSITSISRRKTPNEAILCLFKFVPLIANLTMAESTSVTAQLLCENNNSKKLKIVEIYEDSNLEPLSPLLQDSFLNIPLIQTEVIVLSQTDQEIRDVTVKKEPFSSKFTSCAMVVVSKVLTKPKSRNLLEDIFGSLNENGAILSRECRDFNPSNFETHSSELCLLSVHKTETEQLVLFRKKRAVPQQAIIDVTDTSENFEWLLKLQQELLNKGEFLLLSQNQTRSGILGFQKSLKCEAGTGNVKCVFLMAKGLNFDTKDDFFAKQLEKGLMVNVFKNGQWGTYRHILLGPPEPIESEHIVGEVTVKGDLFSFSWMEGPLTSRSTLSPEKELVYIYSSEFNLRSGRINNEDLKESNIRGFDYAGKTLNGKRVMGIAYGNAMTSMVEAEKHSVWEIPNDLTFDDAATIPLAYATVLYSLIMVAKIREGQSILIHAGSGAVGKAAIHVASYYKCDIFTTVGSDRKKKILKKLFPHLKDNQIGNSSDCSFEHIVKLGTDGSGVDIVLNSLPGEHQQEATVRCLASAGTYLELEKSIKNRSLAATTFSKGCSFHGINLDLLYVKNPKAMQTIAEIIKDGLIKGYVKPLNKILFGLDEVENAYTFIAKRHYTGQVVIKIRDENETQIYKGLPEFYCDPKKSYIIIGGLGGFGVELADWLVLRGAKKLVLVSRTGVKNGYQAFRINNWEKHGVKVVVTTDDVISKKGCVSVINRANNLGPVDAIFNLAVVLQDGLFENQTEEKFRISLGAKAIATENFDEISRKMCPELKYFVAFSSMSSGLGNAGQTNYAMGNSRCERICEERNRQGYPALAIQWGAIGDVGMVAEEHNVEKKAEIGGTMQQPIASCLRALKLLLKQNEPVVASMVVAEKKNKLAANNNLVDAARIIMGFKTLKGISMDAKFSQLGMDSIMAIEMLETLDREYGVSLTASEIINMTYASLQQMMSSSAGVPDETKS